MLIEFVIFKRSIKFRDNKTVTEFLKCYTLKSQDFEK